MELDAKLAETNSSSGGTTFKHYASLLQKRSLLKLELQTHQASAGLVEEMLAYTALVCDNSCLMNDLAKGAAAALNQVDCVVNQYTFPIITMINRLITV